MKFVCCALLLQLASLRVCGYGDDWDLSHQHPSLSRHTGSEPPQQHPKVSTDETDRGEKSSSSTISDVSSSNRHLGWLDDIEYGKSKMDGLFVDQAVPVEKRQLVLAVVILENPEIEPDRCQYLHMKGTWRRNLAIIKGIRVPGRSNTWQFGKEPLIEVMPEIVAKFHVMQELDLARLRKSGMTIRWAWKQACALNGWEAKEGLSQLVKIFQLSPNPMRGLFGEIFFEFEMKKPNEYGENGVYVVIGAQSNNAEYINGKTLSTSILETKP